MAKINLNKVSKNQKQAMREALEKYCSIMEYRNNNNLSKEFEQEYSVFYLKARRLKNEYKAAYFKILKQKIHNNNVSVCDFESILDKIHKTTGTYEYSLTTKLMHTVNNSIPIYDSKVRKYLTKCEGVGLSVYGSSDKRKQTVIKSWQNLNDWYADIESKKADWIDWFDKEFPEYKDCVSAVKKVDFIIFCLT